jgi:hypothetical protein
MSNIRQYLPLIAKPNKEQAPRLNALIDGVDDIVSHLENYTEYAQNQFFFTTADAEYVFKLAARNGFYLPRDAGLNIEGLKPLAPLMINQPKTSLEILLRVLEIYFSQTLTRPSVISAQAEPYRLKEKDDLIIKTRDAEHRLTIDKTMFSNIKNVSASELATYINSVQDHYIATVFYDRTAEKNKIRLMPSGSGLNEIIQVTGGTLQNLLLFPNVIPTTNSFQTRWFVSKIADHSDIVTFTYMDGPPPSTHLAKVGDIVTIRGQFDVGASGAVQVPVQDIFGNDVIDNNGNLVTILIYLIEGNYSVLNGTHEIIEVGYNYFKIRNKYLRLPNSNNGEIVQLSTRDVIFTENTPHRVYDQETFSYITEMTDDELNVTVPAVPPIVKRFLQGAWHAYGARYLVNDFTRNTVRIDIFSSVQIPPQGVSFVLDSGLFAANYAQKKYKILNTNPSNGIVTLDTSDEYGVLPYTTPALIGKNNPFFCDLESNTVEVDFNYRHGLVVGSEIVINAAAINPESNININGSWVVDKVLSDTKISFKLNEKNIAPPSSSAAVLFSLGDKKYRLQFPSAMTLNLSKINVIGKKFKLYEDGTANVFNTYAWQKLKTRYLIVTSVGATSIEFEVMENWSVVPNELIAANVRIQTTQTNWGEDNSSYYFDKSAARNQEVFINGLIMTIADYIKPNSPLYLGSYLYDPQGKVNRYLPSAIGTISQAPVLRGESGVLVTVDSAAEFNQNGGYVVFEYGTAVQEGPVPYITLSGGQIVIDPAYVFKKTHSKGATVRQVEILEPFIPSTNGLMFQPFLTGTSKARDSFFEIIKTIISAGVFVTDDVLYPKLRFADESIEPYK